VAQDISAAVVIDRRIPVRLLTWAWNRAGWPPIERLAGRCDVVHAQSPLLIPSVRAAQVVTIHDLDFLHHPERAAAEMRRDYPALVASHARRADGIIVSSRYTAGEVVRHLGVEATHVRVCRPGPPSWAAEVAERRRRSAKDGESILFVGTLEARKNVGGLIEAYRRLSSARPDAPPLVLAGRPTSTAATWTDQVSRARLDGRVQFLGYVDAADRPSLYERARMLVLPSLEEGFGLPVLEAMACGVPVVVSNRGALPEVAGPAATPVDPGDTEGLAVQMEQLLHREHAVAAAARGLKQAARYSWSACAAAAHAAYGEAVAARRRR
jgi:glycosyltransferase involved in cell wall biosynthesis